MPGLFYSENNAQFRFTPSGVPASTDKLLDELDIVLRPDGAVNYFAVDTNGDNVTNTRAAKIRYVPTGATTNWFIPLSTPNVGGTAITIYFLVPFENSARPQVMSNQLFSLDSTTLELTLATTALETKYDTPTSSPVANIVSSSPGIVPLIVDVERSTGVVGGFLFEYRSASGFTDANGHQVKPRGFVSAAATHAVSVDSRMRLSGTSSTHSFPILSYDNLFYYVSSPTAGFTLFDAAFDFKHLFFVKDKPSFVSYNSNNYIVWQMTGTKVTRFTPAQIIPVNDVTVPATVDFYISEEAAVMPLSTSRDGQIALPLVAGRQVGAFYMTYIPGLSATPFAAPTAFAQVLVVSEDYVLPARANLKQTFFPNDDVSADAVTRALAHPRAFPFIETVDNSTFAVTINGSVPTAATTKLVMNAGQDADLNIVIVTGRPLTGYNLWRQDSGFDPLLTAAPAMSGTYTLKWSDFLQGSRPRVYYRGDIPVQSWTASASFAALGVILTFFV